MSDEHNVMLWVMIGVFTIFLIAIFLMEYWQFIWKRKLDESEEDSDRYQNPYHWWR